MTAPRGMRYPGTGRSAARPPAIQMQRRHLHALHAARVESTNRMRAVSLTLNNVHHGIVNIDADGRIRLCNQRALDLLELPASVLAEGRRFEDVVRFQIARGDFTEVTPTNRTGPRQFVDGAGERFLAGDYVRAMRSGGHLEVKTTHLTNGSRIRTYVDVTPYIHAQQAAQESERELRTMLDGFPGHVIVSDADLMCTYINEGGAAWLGRPREALLGRSCREYLTDERAAEILDFLARARTGEQHSVVSEYPATSDQARRWFQVTHVMGHGSGGSDRKCCAFAIDVTERKLAEAALIEAKEEAERANSAKSDFLRSISHELHTPMNAISGFAELLASNDEWPLSDSQTRHIEEIRRGSRHLLGLINELLNLSMAEQGTLEVTLEDVGVRELIDECVGLLAPLAQQAGISIHHDSGQEVLEAIADRTRLKQMLLNVMANAIKYGRRGSSVRIAPSCSEHFVMIGVTDDGPGLSESQRACLFKPFERLEGERTRTEGAGLGLSLSRSLLGAMGGSIGVDSEVGQGSTFTIEVRRSETGAVARGLVSAPAVARAAEQDGPVAASGRKVLYIEDNAVNTMLMEAMLARLPADKSVTLFSAELPEVGLSMAVAERPDLILLDIQLPGINGFEVLRRLRANTACRHIPVVAVSANTLPGDIEIARAAGFERYLAKPFEMHELHAMVTDVLARSAVRDLDPA